MVYLKWLLLIFTEQLWLSFPWFCSFQNYKIKHYTFVLAVCTCFVYVSVSLFFFFANHICITCLYLRTHSFDIFINAFTKQDMDLAENNLKDELENVQASLDAGQSSDMSDSAFEPKVIEKAKGDTETLLEKLDNKKKELVC